MKKIFILFLIIFVTASCSFAAKYKVNTSGTVTQNGKVITPTQTQTKNYYNVYQSNNYVSSNQVNQTYVPVIELVMDYSGSMANWIQEAKNAMRSIISQIPSSVSVGFRVFGHDNNGMNLNNKQTIAQVKKIVKQKNGKYKAVAGLGTSAYVGQTTGYCSATTQVTSIMKANSNALLNGMNSVNVGGSTPLTYGLDRAIYSDLAKFSISEPKKIVLITDGGENCGGDPCNFAKELMKTRSDITIDVVLVGNNSKKLSCLATTTGGNFYTVKNLSTFSAVLTQSMSTPPAQTQIPAQKYEYSDK